MIEEDENLLTLNQFEANNLLQQTEYCQINEFISNQSTVIINENSDVNIKRAINTVLELTEDEINKIEENLRFKIIKNSENFLHQYDNLRASSEKLKIEYEQNFLELESEYNECRTKLESESLNSHLNQTKANEFDEKLSTLQKQNRILNDEKETLISNVQRSNSINQNLESEKRDLHFRLDKYIRENDRLNEEWKSMNNKLTEIESKLALSTAKLEESNSREATITFREKQYQSDKQRLLNEIEWLNNELEKKSSQILQTRSEYNQKTFEYESKLEDLTAENKKLKSLNETLQTANQAMEQQIEEITTKLQDIREKYAQSKIDFDQESESREKIIQLYKEENLSSKTKLDEAANAINDLKQMVIEVKDEYSKLLDEKTSTETAFESKLKENVEIIGKLEQELKNANELLSIAKRKGATVLSEADIEQLSPAAAVASRLLKNGMTLTQIYSEYVNLAENLQSEKNENQRLTSYINEIIKEIEEKAPVLKKQKQEYEEAVKTIDSLTNQLENAMMDYEVLKSKSEDSIKKYNLVSSENIRLRQDCNDLSRQVTVLLHEVEKLRSKLLNTSRKSFNLNKSDLTDLNQSNMSMNETDSTPEVSSSTEVISKDILLFRNIEELQKQNQKLVRLLHEVTDKKQSEEKNELEQKTKEYNEKLNLAVRELEEFKIQREKHEQVLDEIRKQRDTYKQLLNSQHHQQQRNIQHNQLDSATSFFTSTPGGHKTSSSSDNKILNGDILKDEQKKELNEKTMLLEKLQKQFETYQTEMMITNKILNEEIETYRSANSELSMKLALSDSRLESTLEKCKSLNIAIEKCRKELETNKERNSKLNEFIIKHEQSLSLTSQELNKSNEKLCEYETKLHSMTFERDMLKSNYERIVKERDLLIQESSNRSSIMTNLEMIKNSCERNERETKLIYTQKIDQLEKENLIQRKQLEQDQEKHEVIIKSWQTQYEHLQQTDEKEKEEHKKTRQFYTEIKLKFDELKDKYDQLEAKLHSNELIVQMTRNTKSSSAISRITHLEEETKDLHMKLSLADKEIVSLKIQLEDSRGHAKQYKSIAETMEKTVKESSETNEKTKMLLEMKINDLETRLMKLNGDYETIALEKANLELTLSSQIESSSNRIDLLEKEKKQLDFDLDLLKKKLQNAERIIEERSKHRDEYVAKIAIYEDKLNDNENKLILADKELIEKTNQINEFENLIKTRNSEIELEKRTKLEIKQSYEEKELLLNETLVNIKKENESLTLQINLLQQELSKLGQDLIILQKQDSFKTKNRQSLSMELNTENLSQSMLSTETGPDDLSTSSNLLEINRYLRVQKDQLEERYENMKLSFDINQQRIRNLDTDLEFYRKQSQSYESELLHLKASIENFKTTSNFSTDNKSTTENFNLILSTNKRLKEECDSLNAESDKLKTDVLRLEEEISNLKSTLSESELRNESFKGEYTCMVTELKRWKERCDALLQSSEHADEWAKIKIEVQKAQEKAQDLTDMINELRKNLSDSNSKGETLVRELEAVKSQAMLEKSKLQQDLDSLRSEKVKRDEMFKTLVNELREVVILVQRELELKNVDWSMKGQGADKLKSIKEEIQQLKMSITEKLKSLKEEIKNKPKQLDDLTNEVGQLNKKLEETDNKIKEKDTRIGQMQNFIAQMKTKLSTLQKAKDDAVKDLTDFKSSSSHVIQPETNEQVNKTELDTLRSRFLQSQFENERLKKELASTNSALIDANLQANSKITSQQSINQQQQTSNTNVLGSSTTSPQQKLSSQASSITASNMNTNNENQQAPPPTAYIVPSRITKSQQQQQTTQQSSQQQSSNNNLSIRRTAAVQPTPHDAGNSVGVNTMILLPNAGSQRQQLVTPILSNESQQQQQETTNEQSSFLMIQSIASSSTSNASTSNFINKRTREDDQAEDSVQPGTSVNASNNTNNNKKIKNNENLSSNLIEQSNQHQSIVAIEPYPTTNNPASYSDQNDYIVINDEIQSSDIHELQDSQEEIILDDDEEENNDNPTSESQENEFDVIITKVRRNENLQQNILSSTSENQQGSLNQNQTTNENNVQLDDYENVVGEDESNTGINDQDDNENNEDIDQENNEDDVLEDDEESNQRAQENNDDDDGDEDHDLRLEENDQENTDSNMKTNTESNDDNQNDNNNIGQEDENNGDSQTDAYEENNQNNFGVQSSVSPDSSAPQSGQEPNQQQQNIQSCVVSSESNNFNANQTTQLKVSNASTTATSLFGQQQSSNTGLTQTKNIMMPSTSTFGSGVSNATVIETRKEPPKPIVWDASANPSQQLFQPLTSTSTTAPAATATTTSNNFRIRRPPVNPFQQQGNTSLTASNPTATAPNFFQTDNAIQQQASSYRLQNNPFQLQQSTFIANQSNLSLNAQPGLINEGQQRLINTQQRASLIRNQRLQQSQLQPQPQPTQQNVRLLTRGGGVAGSQNRRGGGNSNASGPTGTGINPAQRGGRTNF